MVVDKPPASAFTASERTLDARLQRRLSGETNYFHKTKPLPFVDFRPGSNDKAATILRPSLPVARLQEHFRHFSLGSSQHPSSRLHLRESRRRKTVGGDAQT